MQPEISLNVEVLRHNVRTWREHAEACLRAVIKSQGYGWGFKAIVDAVDDIVDGYYVSDRDEFEQVHPLTQRPIVTLVDVCAQEVSGILDRAGVPTISSSEGLYAADAWSLANGKRARIRIAIRGAVGWSGIKLEQIGEFAALLARLRIDVELSSHITDTSLQAEQTKTFEAALSVLQNANVSVVATDLASSLPLATNVAKYSHVRVGVGLFGARFGSHINVKSAIAVRAPVVEVIKAEGQHIGYGVRLAPLDGSLAVVRCGYGDGFPRVRQPTGSVLAVGMQFTTVHSRGAMRKSAISLIDRETDLDLLAASAETSVHELVVALGKNYRLNGNANSRSR